MLLKTLSSLILISLVSCSDDKQYTDVYYNALNYQGKVTQDLEKKIIEIVEECKKLTQAKKSSLFDTKSLLQFSYKKMGVEVLVSFYRYKTPKIDKSGIEIETSKKFYYYIFDGDSDLQTKLDNLVADVEAKLASNKK